MANQQDNASQPRSDDGGLERAVAGFEEAWQRGPRPELEECLAGAPQAAQQPLLIELVHIDLEYRLKAKEEARVEDYLARFPDLASHEQVLLDLLRAEYELRRRSEPQLSIDEFRKRFPQHGDTLAEHLSTDPRPPRGRLLVRLNCPHCQTAIQVVDDESVGEVLCPSCGSSFRLDHDRTHSWKPEKLPRLGKFELLEPVGRGAFGTVYRARDTELDRIVAVKIPRSGQLSGGEDEDRFLREARSVAQLRHPGIVPVYETGRSETFPYIVTEFVHGLTLADLLTARTFDSREAAELVASVAESLAYAHARGVIHRDVKPSNVMLDESGKPHLMDFGLARRDAGEITVTVEGQILGTPAYMSPEQARGEGHKVDGRSDIYSLGVVLYELLTGERPFRGNSRMLLHQVLNDEPRAPRMLNDRIPKDLETICLKSLDKEAGRRYDSAGEFAADLHRFLKREPILARPIGRFARGWRWANRNRVVAGLVTAILLLLMALTTGSTISAISIRKSRDSERSARVLAQQKTTDEQLALQSLQQSQDDLKGQLAESLIQQARALWLSQEVGWRKKSLDAITQARSIQNDARLIDLAAQALMGRDLELEFEHKFDEPVRAIAMSPEGNQLVIATTGTILVADRQVDAFVLRSSPLSTHSSQGVVLRYSASGETLAIGTEDGQLICRHVDAGKAIAEVQLFDKSVQDLVFGPGPNRITATDGTAIVIWDYHTNEQWRELLADEPPQEAAPAAEAPPAPAAAYDSRPTEGQFLRASHRAKLRREHAFQREVVLPLPPAVIASSEKGAFVAACREGIALQVWRLDDDTLTPIEHSIPLPSRNVGLCMNAAGNLLILATNEFGELLPAEAPPAPAAARIQFPASQLMFAREPLLAIEPSGISDGNAMLVSTASSKTSARRHSTSRTVYRNSFGHVLGRAVLEYLDVPARNIGPWLLGERAGVQRFTDNGVQLAHYPPPAVEQPGIAHPAVQQPSTAQPSVSQPGTALSPLQEGGFDFEAEFERLTGESIPDVTQGISAGQIAASPNANEELATELWDLKDIGELAMAQDSVPQVGQPYFPGQYQPLPRIKLLAWELERNQGTERRNDVAIGNLVSLSGTAESNQVLVVGHAGHCASVQFDQAQVNVVDRFQINTSAMIMSALSVDSGSIATVDRDNQIRLWTRQSSEFSRPIRTETLGWGKSRLVPTTNLAFQSNTDGGIDIVDLRSGITLEAIGNSNVTDFASSVNGDTLALVAPSGSEDNRISVFSTTAPSEDAATRNTASEIGVESATNIKGQAIALTPDGKTLIVGGIKSAALAWKRNSQGYGKPFKFGPDDGAVFHLAVSPKGSVVAAAYLHEATDKDGRPRGYGVLRIFRTEDGAMVSELADLPLSGVLRGLAFSGDEKTIVVGSSGNEVMLCDVSTLKKLKTLQTEDTVSCAEFVGDTSLVAIGDSGGNVEIVDSQTGKRVFRWKAHRFGISALAFAGTDGQLISADISRSIKEWNLGRVEAELRALQLTTSQHWSYAEEKQLFPNSQRHEMRSVVE